MHAELVALPVEKDFPFVEPDDLDEIRALCGDYSDGTQRLEDLDDAMHGAWLGRAVGCALGKPVEAYMSPHQGLKLVAAPT